MGNCSFCHFLRRSQSGLVLLPWFLGKTYSGNREAAKQSRTIGFWCQNVPCPELLLNEEPWPNPKRLCNNCTTKCWQLENVWFLFLITSTWCVRVKEPWSQFFRIRNSGRIATFTIAASASLWRWIFEMKWVEKRLSILLCANKVLQFNIYHFL